MDDVSVNLLPEKKGTVFKHNEYMVESKVWWRNVINALSVCCVQSTRVS